MERRKVIVCRPHVLAVGVDPGPSMGAVAVVATLDSGRPWVVTVQEWRKDKRKQPRNRYRLWSGGHRELWQESDLGTSHPDRVVARIAHEAAQMAEAAGWELVGGVENIQMHGPPRAGLLNLASAAGGNEALLRHIMEAPVCRPSERVWVKQVAAVPSRMRKAQTRQSLRAAYEATARDEMVVDWRLRFEGATPSEHGLDAIGVALYAAGAQLVTPQRRENNDRTAEDRRPGLDGWGGWHRGNPPMD